MKQFKTGALIAIAAGGLFASACKKEEKPADPPKTEPAKTEEAPKVDPAVAPPKAEDKPVEATVEQPTPTEKDEKVAKVDCAGVNACKGKGTCAGENHGCGGQNECKGKGVLSMTEEECKTKGGTVAKK